MNFQPSAPLPISTDHILDNFCCGEPTLDDWLKRRALANHFNGASRTFVVVNQDLQVLAYYALATGTVSHNEAPGSIRRNMPDPIPVIVLGRLAVDLTVQGKKFGPSLLQDAVIRTQTIAANTGVRALLVHALNETAKQFYIHYGFQVSPANPMTLMLRIRVNN